ncbi:hypothetical protein EG68_03941 [Paragonimus skrjabini miyazakii]|uniref:dual-specificity kinase n=1 Tax=Paragonimus skrjabini miyazakii TaxID=59628 RepID=A0A8S9YWE2_9TREM|nr:hypothetical protein EG68_03941 [Paragonimus skrjabini miyazakii]
MALYPTEFSTSSHRYIPDTDIIKANRQSTARYDLYAPTSRYRGSVPTYQTNRPKNSHLSIPFYDSYARCPIYETSSNYKGIKSGSTMNLDLSGFDRISLNRLHSPKSKYANSNLSSARMSNGDSSLVNMDEYFARPSLPISRSHVDMFPSANSGIRRYGQSNFRQANNAWATSRECLPGDYERYIRNIKNIGSYNALENQSVYETVMGSIYFNPQKTHQDVKLTGRGLYNPHQTGNLLGTSLSQNPLSKNGGENFDLSNTYQKRTSKTFQQTIGSKWGNEHTTMSASPPFERADYQLEQCTSADQEDVDATDDNKGGGRISPQEALRKYWRKLTQYEKSEIMRYPDIYFLGLSAKKVSPVSKSTNSGSSVYNTSKIEVCENFGFDDSQSGYIVVLNDHIAYRYEVIKVLGKGSFGQVVHAHDHLTGMNVALKIIRNEERFSKQAKEEIRILQALNEQDKENKHNIVRLLDHFIFRRHVCMVFELLDLNLYEILHRNDFRGLSQETVSGFARGILECLELLYRNNIIHCDLKPENILLRRSARCSIKVIDFGSSCYLDKRIYTYIQSRFYRAPEIILGMEYGTPIDMWSLGCIVAEMITGLPLFPGENEEDQLARIMEILDVPPNSVLSSAKRGHKFFTRDGEPLYVLEQKCAEQSNENGQDDAEGKKDLMTNITNVNNTNNGGPDSSHMNDIHRSISLKEKAQSKKWKPRGTPKSLDLLTAITAPKRSSVCLPGSEHLRRRPSRSFLGRVEPIDMDLLDFLNGCLVWSPEDRMTPLQALRHPWINKHRVRSPRNAHSSDMNGSISANLFNGVKIPESVRTACEDTDDLLRKMQQVRVRKPMVSTREDEEHKVKRSSHAARTERSNSKNRRRYSTGHETSRYLIGPYDRHDSLTESNSTANSGAVGNRPSGEQNYREFLNNGKDNFENASKSPPALIITSADDMEVFRKHRPRRPTNRQRESMLIRVDDSRTRRLSTAFDNVIGSS